MKKLLPILLAVLLLSCLLCACGDDTSHSANKTTNTTQPVGDASNTKIYYQTNAAGSTITTVIVLPEEGEPFPIETADPTQTKASAATTSPTFNHEDDNPFNEATLAW